MMPWLVTRDALRLKWANKRMVEAEGLLLFVDFLWEKTLLILYYQIVHSTRMPKTFPFSPLSMLCEVASLTILNMNGAPKFQVDLADSETNAKL